MSAVEQWTKPRPGGPVPDRDEAALLNELRVTGLVQTWNYFYRCGDDDAVYWVAVPYEDDPRELTPRELHVWLDGVADAVRHMSKQ